MVEEVKNLHVYDKLIHDIESFLVLAKKGNIRGCVIYYEPVVSARHNYFMYYGFNYLEAIGASERLSHKINKDWDEDLSNKS